MQRTAAKRAASVAALAAMVLLMLLVVGPSRANAAPQAAAQTTSTTEPTFTTPVAPGETAPNGGPLLVPGASDAPTAKTDDVKDSDNTGTVVALVITGLLVVALLLGLLTYWYWRQTRPSRPATAGEEAWPKSSMSTP